MANKALFETRGESCCSETTFRLKKLSECRSNIDDQLRRWHLSQHIESVQEHELILNRSALPHDLASKLERLWICAKYRHDMGKKKKLVLSNELIKVELLRWPTRAIQKYKFQYNNIYYSTTTCNPGQKNTFQYNNIYSSTTICFSVQQYLSQYKNIYSSTKRCVFQYRYIFLFRYRTINSSTEIYIRVRKDKFQYRNISFSTEIYPRPRVEAQ